MHRVVEFIKVLTSLVFVLIMSCGGDDPDPGTDPTEPPEEVLTATEIVSAMGTGFNLGNTFDLEINSVNPSDIYPIIDFYAEAGMKHIRIPTTWMDGFSGDHLANEQGELNQQHPRLAQLKLVIDHAIDKDLYVILNTHHEHWLYENFEDFSGNDFYGSLFSRLWIDIASYFKDYSQKLIFEVLNEPQGNFGQFGGEIDETANIGHLRTRQINRLGLAAIRGSGGNNPTRIVMFGVNAWGNQSQLDDVYPSIGLLPGGGEDEYVAAHLHTYDPWEFCGQDGSDSAYPGAATIAAGINAALDHAELLGVPVCYGEFGVGRRNNNTQRDNDTVREFYKTIRETTAARGASCTVWDDRGWFGLIDGNSGSGYRFLYNIVPNMLTD